MRSPDQTRKILLDAAYEEIHHYGFQAASLSRILANTGLTKGALYHHFPTKLALGYAVVDEVIHEEILNCWATPLTDCQDPVDCLMNLLQKAAEDTGDEFVEMGCPLNNLAQEMSSVDEGFRQKLGHIYTLWRQAIANALARGQANGKVRADVDTGAAAIFIVAAIEGCLGMAKNARDINLLFECGAGLLHYLDTLHAKP